jgi:hypothetical protein
VEEVFKWWIKMVWWVVCVGDERKVGEEGYDAMENKGKRRRK